MTTIAWEFAHSVDTAVAPDFAWLYWTNVANWDDPPAKFELHGPFQSGTRGITNLPGLEPLHWVLQQVTPPSAATLELLLRGATLRFEWRFTPLPDGGTRLTQRLVLQGENSPEYLAQVTATFPVSLPDGMKRIAAAMTDSFHKKIGRPD